MPDKTDVEVPGANADNSVRQAARVKHDLNDAPTVAVTSIPFASPRDFLTDPSDPWLSSRETTF